MGGGGRGGGDAAPGSLVQVVLEQPGSAPRELGALAVTRGARFGGTVTIPGDVAPGDYALRAYVVP
ncbi:MAG: hypothetical protein JXB32_19520, partial [Deltaproteobacteria bacterium]|nr:hypothetical protein [Deltaproteobacteria bacterium]